MRQRLQLAVACLHRPEVLILDEPTSGVDPAARDMFWRLLGDLSRDHGVTIFVSTHFMNEAERCDRISLMHAGTGPGRRQRRRRSARARGAATLEDAFVAVLAEAPTRRRPGLRAIPAGGAAAAMPPHPGASAARRGELRTSLRPNLGLRPARDARVAARPGAPRLCAAQPLGPDDHVRLRHHLRCREPAIRGVRPRPERREPAV